MVETEVDRGALITAAGIARASGVKVQAVSNWVRRQLDFPAPQGGKRHPEYRVGEVARWLDGRAVQADQRRLDEGPDATLGQRFRRSLGLLPDGGVAAGPSAASAPSAASGPATGGISKARSSGAVVPDSEAWDEAVWAPLQEVLETADPDQREQHQDLVLAMLWLRAVDPDRWRQVRSGAPSAQEVVRRCWAETVGPASAEGEAEDVDPLRFPARGWWASRVPEVAAILSRVPVAPAFDVLLDRFARERPKGRRAYLTPASVVETMVRLAAPRPGEQVLDPCCGYGEFLVAAGRELAARRADQSVTGTADAAPVVVGAAPTGRLHALAAMHAAVHGMSVAVERQDLLRRFPDIQRRGDVVLTNPPFTHDGWADGHRARSQDWPFGSPPRHSSVFGWLQVAVAALAPGGRAVIVMPPGAADPHHEAERVIVRGLVDSGVLRCVIDLPGGLFRESTTAVSLWVLSPIGAEPRGDVLLIDAESASERAEGTYRVVTRDGQARIVDAYRAWSASVPGGFDGYEGLAVAVTVEQLRAEGYVLRPALHLRSRPVPGSAGAAPGRAGRGRRAAGGDAEDLRRELARLQQLAAAARAALVDAWDGVDGRESIRVDAGCVDAGCVDAGGVDDGGDDGALDTLVGAVPRSWRVAALGEIAKVTIGPSRLSERVRTTDGVPVVGPQAIAGGRIDLSRAPRIDARGAVALSRHRLVIGDVVLARTGDRQAHARVRPGQEGAIVHGSCIRLRPSAQVLPEYLDQYLAHPTVQEWLALRVHQGVIASVRVGLVAQLPVVVPPRREQERVAAALAAADDLVDLHEQLVDLSHQLRGHLARGLLIGHRPLPEPMKRAGETHR